MKSYSLYNLNIPRYVPKTGAIEVGDGHVGAIKNIKIDTYDKHLPSLGIKKNIYE